MLRRFWEPVRRIGWEKVAARVGAFASRHKPAGRALLFAGGFALVVLLIHREVYWFITRRPQFSVPEIQSAVAPRWAEQFGVETVRVEGQGTSIFDPGLVGRVGLAFESCPWIKRVVAVERDFPDRLRVRFEYRRAHVAVRRPNGYVLVDEEGVRLPGVFIDPPACERGAVVTGLTSPPAEPGKKWDDPGLAEAMAMAEVVHRNDLLRRIGVREIDVSNFGGRADARRSEVVLVTAAGCEVAWGRTGSTARFGDPSMEEKLESLREVMAAYPELNGLRRVKLYFRGARAVEPADTNANAKRTR
jgi:hypothetical protein